MSTATYLSALAFSSTSLLAAAPATAGAAGEASGGDVACRLAMVEAELALATEPDLYLVLDLDAGRLEAAVRGVRFDPVPAALEVRSRAEEEGPELPAVHRVDEPAPPPAGRARPSVGAPPSATPTAGGSNADRRDPKAAPDAVRPTPPAIPLEDGDTLELRASPPPERGAEATPDEPPVPTGTDALVLTLSAEALPRVRHRLRPGVALLVVGGCGPPRPENR